MRYFMPVTWEMYGLVCVEADSVDEAIENFQELTADYPLPDDGDYVEGSWRLSDDNIDELKSMITELK